MVFFDTIGRGWTLSKLSFSVVKADPELLLYTFLSALMVFATIGAASYPAYEADQTSESHWAFTCLLYTSPSPRDATLSRMPSSA